MITVSGLTKRYGKKIAVNNASFTINRGDIVGLLGPNGAGKTTTMNMITGYISSTGGKISIGGYDILENPNEAKAKIGYLPEQPPLYHDMTVKEYLNFVYNLKGCSKKENIKIKDYIEDMENYLAACDLVISRAGALSVAETTVCGKAAILIPSPNVTGNHQYFNAKAVADRGGALLIEERDLDAQKLVEEVLRLKNNPALLEAMSKASRACAPDEALDIIYNTVIDSLK